MSGVADFVFCLVFAGLLAHELDAVKRREWRLLFVLRRMPEDAARRAFVLLHVPLLAALLWLVSHPDASVRLAAFVALDVFAVVHAGLHHRLSRHASYEFRSGVSRALIGGPALLALVHLGLVALSRWTLQRA